MRELADGETLTLAGLELHRRPRAGPHARVGDVPAAADGRPDVMFSGDLLFAGSIGRTDLPGGDYATMLEQPGAACAAAAGRDRRAARPRRRRPPIGRERATNPFLAGRRPRSTAPHRGL